MLPTSYISLNSKTLARIAFIQYIYKCKLLSLKPFKDDGVKSALSIFNKNIFCEAFGVSDKCNSSPNLKHLDNILEGYISSSRDILHIIDTNLEREGRISSLHITLLSVIIGGVTELSKCQDIPHKVVIREYCDIASEMLASLSEVDFVNYILDKIHKKLSNETTK